MLCCHIWNWVRCIWLKRIRNHSHLLSLNSCLWSLQSSYTDDIAVAVRFSTDFLFDGICGSSFYCRRKKHWPLLESVSATAPPDTFPFATRKLICTFNTIEYIHLLCCYAIHRSLWIARLAGRHQSIWFPWLDDSHHLYLVRISCTYHHVPEQSWY